MSGTESLSLREVADRAGVAMSSVSRVLSGHPDVSPAMRARVMAVVDELGYEPDLLASSLRRGSTMTVALVLPDVSSPPFSGIALGAERTLREAGYAMLLANSDGEADVDAAHINLFRRRRVDGLLLWPSDETDRAVHEQVQRLQSPFVLLDRELPAVPAAGAVLRDHASAAELVAEHLRGFGHRRIALVPGPAGPRSARGADRAFEAACARLGLELQSGGDAVHALARSPRPTAVVSGSCELLPAALHAVRAHGLRIPADVSLVTLDDEPMLAALDPPVTSVSHDPVAIGREAARLLLRRLAGAPASTSAIPARLDVRESSGPAPS